MDNLPAEDSRSELHKAAEAAGWLDLHGEPMSYLRGINPETKRMEAVPQSLLTQPTQEDAIP